MSKRRQFLHSCAAGLPGLIGIYLGTALLLDKDFVAALAAPAIAVAIMIVGVVAIGRWYPNYFMYRGAIEFWFDLQVRRDRRSRSRQS